VRLSTGSGLGRLGPGLFAAAALVMVGLSPGSLIAQGDDRCQIPPGINATRPDPPGTPTEVSVGLWVNDLRGIDDARQSYDADLVVLLNWTDPRLDTEQMRDCRVPQNAVWSPRPVFRNERGTSGSFADVVTIREGGLVDYVQRHNGLFTSSLKLKDFPFDSQMLEASVVLRGLQPDDLRFERHEDTGTANSLSIADWRVGEWDVDFVPLAVGQGARELAQVNFRIQVVRNRAYYIQKIFLPLFLIVVMSWAVFWIDPTIMPAQVGISTSAVLTLIAFLFSLGQLLPRLSYLTRADRFVMGATILVFMAFGEALLTTGLASRDRKARALRIDLIARFVFPVLFAGVLLYAFVL